MPLYQTWSGIILGKMAMLIQVNTWSRHTTHDLTQRRCRSLPNPEGPNLGKLSHVNPVPKLFLCCLSPHLYDSMNHLNVEPKIYGYPGNKCRSTWLSWNILYGMSVGLWVPAASLKKKRRGNEIFFIGHSENNMADDVDNYKSTHYYKMTLWTRVKKTFGNGERLRVSSLITDAKTPLSLKRI